jgi:hypothetical protein
MEQQEQERQGHTTTIEGVEVSWEQFEWVMENPQALLCQIKSMIKWVSLMEKQYRIRRMTVHLCNWRHWYKKPTHLWTSMVEWKPAGDSGMGVCRCRCKMGFMNGNTGRWNHHYRLGQASQDALGGEGRNAAKATIPTLLHREVIYTQNKLHEHD